MNRFLFFLLVGVFLVTLQTTLLTSFLVQRVRPDLVLILILYLGLSRTTVSGGMVAFLLGYLLDLFSGNAFGVYCFTRPLIFFISRLFQSRFYWEGFSFQCLFVLFFSLVEGCLVFLLLWSFTPSPPHTLYSFVVSPLLPQSVVTALITPFLFALFKKGTVRLTRDSRPDLLTEG